MRTVWSLWRLIQSESCQLRRMDLMFPLGVLKFAEKQLDSISGDSDLNSSKG